MRPTSTPPAASLARIAGTLAGKAQEAAYDRGDEQGIHPPFPKRVKPILALVDQASAPADLAASGYLRHPLKGRPDCWSMRVPRNWRIVIRLKDNEAWDVDLVDYH